MASTPGTRGIVKSSPFGSSPAKRSVSRMTNAPSAPPERSLRGALGRCAQVASGRILGYVAEVHVGGQVAVRAGGRTAVEAESAPMGEDTLFRIASVTKPIGGRPHAQPRAGRCARPRR